MSLTVGCMTCFVWTLIIITFLIVRKLIDVLYRKYYNYPNGSVGFPLIGLFIKGLSYPPNYNRLAELYGPVTMYYFGLSKIIHIHDYEIMKQILNKKQFYQNRHSMAAVGWGKVDGFATESGEKWSKRRKHAQSTFLTILNYNYLGDLMVQTLNNNIFKKLDKFSASDDVWYCKQDIYYLALSSIYLATFGVEMNYNDPDTLRLRHSVEKTIGNIGINMLLSLLSDTINKSILKIFSKMFICKQDYDTTTEILTKWINRADVDETAFLHFMQQCVQQSRMTFEEMLSDIVNLFSLGTHTTSKQIEQIILYAAKYPHIQQKVYDELKRNDFQFRNLDKLHAFRAFIHECLRWTPIVGTSVPRIVKVDNLRVNQYNIPKDSIIVCNYKSINYKKSYWKYPNQFNINNFIDENNKFKRSLYFMSFGYGARDCMGRSLAMRMLYIVIGNLLKHYQICVPPNVPYESFTVPKVNGDVRNIGVTIKKRQIL